ncbi:thrombospondin type 3 repeat-containing protein [Catellatospora vulcania]|uniref:thrombospondin type 3 repeat-containing protein n=1 Tax=Catellatospora vulcania TaxID=1460450 RepID=UPI0012D43AEA|nr:thrombospondin type 3 repeat-containing protein [Catellatospora vulcania]
MMRKLFGAGLATGVFVTLTASVVAPAGAVEEPTRKYSTLRLCDPTACYIAWSVVDSDHDGVCDADELQAGTDPYDPASRPGLELIAELLIDRKLPSFEYGLASLVAFPAEIIKARDALGVDPLGAFPLHERADALTRMGISGDQLSKFGISAERSGFSIGLDGIKPDGTPPGTRVNGMDASLISAGAKDPRNHVFGGGIVNSEKDWWGNTVDTYGDGSTRTTTPIDRGVRIKITDKEGDKAGTIVKHGGTVHEGNTEVTYSNEDVLDSDGNLLQSKDVEHRKEKDGSSTTTTTTTDYVRDGDGKVMGTVTVTVTESTSSSGATSKTTNTAVCDASGKQCTNYPDTTEYVDPEQAYNSMVTQEMVDGVLRLRGAAINVVEGWNAPGMEEDPENPQNPPTIMLIDGTVGELFLLAEPKRITQAQPEGHPGLPSPKDAGPPPAGSGCDGLC